MALDHELLGIALITMHLPSPDVLGFAYFISEFGRLVLRRSRQGATSADKGSLRVLWIVIMLSMAAAAAIGILLPQARFIGPDAARSTGLVLFVVGVSLRWYSILYLGRFFTVNVAIAVDHKVVDTGPYRLMRHPSYTGALIAFLAYGMCLGNAVALPVLMVPITWVFFRRIVVEEEALKGALGSAYGDYAARTKRLIPFVY